MGRWQPYLYNATPRDSFTDTAETIFNPKAVTMASRQPPSPPKKKPNGPLINFNQHPDSYLILPYGKTNAKPMSPKVKTIITYMRWIQLFFRIFTLFGAVGVLLCGIFIKGAQNTEGYIMRIPVGLRTCYRLDTADQIAWHRYCSHPLCHLPSPPGCKSTTSGQLCQLPLLCLGHRRWIHTFLRLHRTTLEA